MSGPLKIVVNFDRILTLLSIIVAVFSLIVALRANTISEAANASSKRANEIAEEQTMLARIQVSPILSAEIPYPEMHVKSCVNSSGSPGVYALVAATLEITNSGGRDASLIRIEYFVNDEQWFSAHYADSYLPEFPFDIPSGSTRSLYLIFDHVYSDILTPTEAHEYISASSKQWNLDIGDKEFQIRQGPEGGKRQYKHITDMTGEGAFNDDVVERDCSEIASNGMSDSWHQ